jgi:hypothetical protein
MTPADVSAMTAAQLEDFRRYMRDDLKAQRKAVDQARARARRHG